MIDHAIRFTAERPARRLRLSRRATATAARPSRDAPADGLAHPAARRASTSPGFPPQARVILRGAQALRDDPRRQRRPRSHQRRAVEPAGTQDELDSLAPRQGPRLRGRRHARPAEAGPRRRVGNPSSTGPGRPRSLYAWSDASRALVRACAPPRSQLVVDGRARLRPPVEGRPPLPGVPPRQPLEPARRPAARRAELAARSSRSIGLDAHVHPDFGSGIYDGAPIGIPYITVSKRTAQGAGAASTTRTSPTAARTRSRRTPRSRAAAARTATAT